MDPNGGSNFTTSSPAQEVTKEDPRNSQSPSQFPETTDIQNQERPISNTEFTVSIPRTGGINSDEEDGTTLGRSKTNLEIGTLGNSSRSSRRVPGGNLRYSSQISHYVEQSLGVKSDQISIEVDIN